MLVFQCVTVAAEVPAHFIGVFHDRKCNEVDGRFEVYPQGFVSHRIDRSSGFAQYIRYKCRVVGIESKSQTTPHKMQLKCTAALSGKIDWDDDTSISSPTLHETWQKTQDGAIVVDGLTTYKPCSGLEKSVQK